MSIYATTLTVTASVILLMEGVLWFLFVRNYRHLLNTEIANAAEARVWTIRKLGIVMLLHTLFLLGCCLGFLIWIW